MDRRWLGGCGFCSAGVDKPLASGISIVVKEGNAAGNLRFSSAFDRPLIRSREATRRSAIGSVSYVCHSATRAGCWTWLPSGGFPLGGGYVAVRVILAAILVSAAALKGYQLATGPVLGTGLFSSRILLIAVVEFEWLLGVWLITGLY